MVERGAIVSAPIDDYRKMFKPSPYVAAHELEGREVTVTISSVVAGVVEGENNRKDPVPIMTFVEAKKPMVCNKTNGKTIAKLYGNKVSGWIGKQITLYPTTAKLKGETVECIRVRPVTATKKDRPAPTEWSPSTSPSLSDDAAAEQDRRDALADQAGGT